LRQSQILVIVLTALGVAAILTAGLLLLQLTGAIGGFSNTLILIVLLFSVGIGLLSGLSQ